MASSNGPAAGPADPAAVPVLLLVDDDDDVARVFTRALERNGFKVRRARTGDEALAVIPGLPRIDAAVVDMVLPGAGGLEVVRAIRQRCPTCRIVAVTALEEGSLEAAFRQAGADAFLRKPVDLDVLLASLSP